MLLIPFVVALVSCQADQADEPTESIAVTQTTVSSVPDASEPATTAATSTTTAATTTTAAGTTTTTSPGGPEFDYWPPRHRPGAFTAEGESNVYFDERFTVEIGQIDDQAVGMVTAFLPEIGSCVWTNITSEDRLFYRRGGSEYEVTVKVPSDSHTEVRVTRRNYGVATGTLPCEPGDEAP